MILCRIFGHKFAATGNAIAGIQLLICKRCGLAAWRKGKRVTT
jgi:hypothetical protein